MKTGLTRFWAPGVMLMLILLGGSIAFHRLPQGGINNAQQPVVEAIRQALARASYGHMPLAFEPNFGQTDKRVKYLARGHGYTLFITSAEAVVALKNSARSDEAVVRVRLVRGATDS